MSLEQTSSVILIFDTKKKHLTKMIVHCSHVGKSYAQGEDKLDFQFHKDGGTFTINQRTEEAKFISCCYGDSGCMGTANG